MMIALFSSCIGEDFVDDVVLIDPSLSIISGNINGQDSILVGDTLLYETKYINEKGDIELIDLTWESSNPEFATVDNSGKVVGIAKGVSNITVRANGKSDSKLVIVDNLERIEIVKSVSSLREGDSSDFNASYYNMRGEMEQATFSWKSSNVSVASIDNNGLLKALSVGQTEVTVMANGIESAPIFVSIANDTAKVTSVSISASSNSILVGDTLHVSSYLRNVNNNIIPGPVNWISSNPSILSIDNNGVATAHTAGSADISANSGNVMSQPISILVNKPVITSRTGNFVSHGSYSVSGTVVMNTKSNGNLELVFTNFSSSSGPGLYVYLSQSTSNGLSIVKLPRTSGNFTVQLPPSIGLNDYNYVLIWCKPFGVTFGSARLN